MAKKKILVIEDDINVRENIVVLLTEEGYEVEMAVNGLKGIELINENSFDLIICDILMPHVDGFEVLARVNKNNENVNVPFIFLTAKVEKDIIEKAFAMGVTNYLLKPFKIDDLLDSITNIFAKKRKTRVE